MGSEPWFLWADKTSRRPRAPGEKASADLKKLRQIFTLVQLASKLRDNRSRMSNSRASRSGTCVCVCVFSSHSFWTSSSLDVPAGIAQEEGHTGFLIHLLSAVHALTFLPRRIQPFLSLVDREVEICGLTI